MEKVTNVHIEIFAGIGYKVWIGDKASITHWVQVLGELDYVTSAFAFRDLASTRTLPILIELDPRYEVNSTKLTEALNVVLTEDKNSSRE